MTDNSKDDEKSAGRLAKEQDQRAARYDKLDRKGHGDGLAPSDPKQKAADARHAAGIYRGIAKAEKDTDGGSGGGGPSGTSGTGDGQDCR